MCTKIKNEKDYIVKVVDYKGNIIAQLKKPKTKGAIVKLALNLVRLYERAKKMNFLTKDLFHAIKNLAETILSMNNLLYLILRHPYIAKTLKEIINTQIQDLEEEIVFYGKVREHQRKTCSVCGCKLVYPAFIVYKKDGKEVKRSEPIGIKCLNFTTDKIWNLIEEVKIFEKNDKPLLIDKPSNKLDKKDTIKQNTQPQLNNNQSQFDNNKPQFTLSFPLTRLFLENMITNNKL